MKSSMAKVDQSAPVVDKRAVANSFSRAAQVYDRLAEVQARVGIELLELLPAFATESGGRVLDLGSGTGYMGRQLAELGMDCDLIELDIAAGMLAASQKAGGGATARVQADMDYLPFARGVFDWVVSSLSVQWSADITAAITGVKNCLQPDGVFAFSTVLDGSLAEIISAWRAVDNHVHVNPFYSEGEIDALIRAAGFAPLNWALRDYQSSFTSAEELLASVKGIGAGNHLAARAQGMMGREKYRRLLNAIERQKKDDGSIVLTYNVLLAVLKSSE